MVLVNGYVYCKGCVKGWSQISISSTVPGASLLKERAFISIGTALPVEKALPLIIDNRPGEVPQQILPAPRQQDLRPANPDGVR